MQKILTLMSALSAEKLAGTLVGYIEANTQTQNEEEQLRLRYGIEVLLLFIYKTAVLYTVALVLHIFLEVFIISMVFMVVRNTAFGLHSQKSLTCTLVTLLMFVPAALISRVIGLGTMETLSVLFVNGIFLYKYAPADTECSPLPGRDNRQKLKMKTMFRLFVLIVLCFVAPSDAIRLLVVLGVSFETVSVLPISYKILRRRMYNYEEYENSY